MSLDALEKYQKIMLEKHQFPEQYFEGETREGFFIEGKMKRAWAAGIEVLLEIDRICRKYGIEFFGYAGTLLGAVRHKGFIPWDQDIDIAMRREDYQKFLQIAKAELPDGWRLLGAAQGSDFFFSRIVNGYGYDTRAEHLLRFHGCPYTVGVDIFPLDYLPDNREEEDVLYYLLRSIFDAIGVLKAGGGRQLEECLQTIEQFCNVKLIRDEGLIARLCRLLDAVGMSYMNEPQENMASLMFMPNPNRRKRYKREWFSKSIRVPFETIEIPIPINSEEVLTVAYGDYMIPRKRLDKYPFYKEMDEEVLRQLSK